MSGRRGAAPAAAATHAPTDARDGVAHEGTTHPPPARDLAHDAWQRAYDAPHAADQRRWLERAHRLAPADGTVALGLATVLLRSGAAQEAEVLFRAVADEHDGADAWLGLAACAHRLGGVGAADALHAALSRGAVSPAARALAAPLAGPAGWCGLDGDGVLHAGPRPPERVALDGRPVVLAWRDGRARLPPGWRRARRVEADTAGLAPLGSPVDVRAITAVHGIVALRDGHVEGWAWHPADPGRDPALLLRRGRARLRVVARDPAPDAELARPLARPRGFRVALAALDGAGPVRVLDENGRDLPGSPLHPGAEARTPVPRRARGGPAGPDAAADVVIPVHGGTAHSLACLRSVLATVPPGTRVHVVDDASPEPDLARALDELAAMGRIRLIRFRRNRGFPAAANAGLRACAGRDAVLLNSDTLVPPGWLERLRAAAHSAPDIGSATPLSGGGGPVGYPGPGATRSDEAGTAALDRLAQRANPASRVDLPTAVGFCMYIRRDCLDATGPFRENLFAQGYGEENDWCLRARRLGWRHVAAADTYVTHRGGASFGTARPALLRRNVEVLHRLYPGYAAEVAAHLAADPLGPARRRMDALRWAEGRRAAGCVVLVTHAGGGGVDEAVAARCAALRAEGLRAVVLRPRGGRCTVQDAAGEGTGEGESYPGLAYRLPAELPDLAALLAPDRPRRVEVHHLLGHDRAVLDLCRVWDVPYDVHAHDYAWLCGRIALVGPGGHYCGEPDPPGCARCEAALGSHLDLPMPALLARSASEFAGARRVVAPSADAAARVRRHVPGVRPEVAPWEDDAALPPLDPAPDGPMRRVCAVGAIGAEKGYGVLLACARDAAARGLPLEFVVVGHTADDAALMAAGPVFVTGPYRPEEAVALIRGQGAHLAFIPSVWPETWCFALSRAWQAGLAAAVFDLGAQAERVRRTGRGWVLPLGLSAAAVNDALLRLAPPASRARVPDGPGAPASPVARGDLRAGRAPVWDAARRHPAGGGPNRVSPGAAGPVQGAGGEAPRDRVAHPRRPPRESLTGA